MKLKKYLSMRILTISFSFSPNELPSLYIFSDQLASLSVIFAPLLGLVLLIDRYPYFFYFFHRQYIQHNYWYLLHLKQSYLTIMVLDKNYKHQAEVLAFYYYMPFDRSLLWNDL